MRQNRYKRNTSYWHTFSLGLTWGVIFGFILWATISLICGFWPSSWWPFN